MTIRSARVRLAIASVGLAVIGAFVATPATVTATPHTPATANAAPATWSHNPASSAGPQYWGSLDPTWTACASSEGQSPVVVTTIRKAQLPALRVDYSRTPLLVENTGHVVEVPQPAAGGGTLMVGDRSYRLTQWHIHAPAEHVVSGQRADLEIHLVHTDPQGRTAVLAIFADILGRQHRPGSSASSHLLRTVVRAAPSTAGEETDLDRTVSAAVLLRAGSARSRHHRVTIGQYLTYTGSLTTPPCTGGIRWFLLAKIITIDPATVHHMHALISTFPGYGSYPDNNRPVQPLGSRTVESSVH
jgi:carbonic anhydrase